MRRCPADTTLLIGTLVAFGTCAACGDASRNGVISQTTDAAIDSLGLAGPDTSGDLPGDTLPSVDSTVLNILDFGADPTGKTLSNDAVEAAIQTAAKRSENVTVLVPPGTFLLRPVQLASNMTLHFEEGAIWQAIEDEDYALRKNGARDSWPLIPAMETFGCGRECGTDKRYEAFVSASNVQNLRISGSGTLRGGGPVWWKLRTEKRLQWTRPRLLEIRNSRNVVVEGITLTQSPFWTLHIYNCFNVLVQNVRITNPMKGSHKGVMYNSTNTDGIDLNSCVSCIVRDSVIDTGDDGVCIKSGLDRSGIERNLPSKDILVQNVTARTWDGAGLAVGSEMSGSVSNVTFSNCHIHDSRYGIRIKSARGRGSVVRNVRFSSIQLEGLNKKAAIELTMFGGDRPDPLKGFNVQDLPVFRELLFENFDIDTASAESGINIDGEYKVGMELLGKHLIRDIIFRNMGTKNIATSCSNAKNIYVDDKAISCELDRLTLAKHLVDELL